MTEKIDIDRIKRLKYQLTIGISVIIVSLITIITVLIVGQSNEILTQKVKDLAYDLDIQANRSLETYIENIVSKAEYVCANTLYAGFDDMDEDLTEEELLEKEGTITERLIELYGTGNYEDLCIVYRNDRILGKVSGETLATFNSVLFSTFEHELTKAEKRMLWLTGYRDDYSRVYYLVQVNHNAIFLISIESSNIINDVITQDNSESGLQIRVLSESGTVIFSNNPEELGMTLTPEEKGVVNERIFTSWIDDDQLAAVSQVSNGWIVVENARTSVVLKQRDEIITYVIIVSSLGIIFAVLITVGLSVKLIVPAENLIKALYYQSTRDYLTGFYSKKNFAEAAKRSLANAEKKKFAFLYIDINDLKGINAKRGHEFGDKVIADLSESARVIFGGNSIYGRTDGDEFAILYPVNETSSFAEEYVERQCYSLKDNLAQRIIHKNRDNIVSLSIGIVMIPDYGKDFELLYDLAERAVYAHKQESNTVCHFYDYVKDYNVWKENKN